ncbi:MAG: hypothetical protein WCR20_15710 [Verrucomicrobiota bacterium]
MKFKKGQTYPGAYIVEELGADKNCEPYYALHCGTQVLAFAVTHWQNPDAPREILVGLGECREAYADHFIQQKSVVPVFIQESPAAQGWCCAGYFKLDRASDEVAEKNQRVNPFYIPAIYKILYLQEVQE